MKKLIRYPLCLLLFGFLYTNEGYSQEMHFGLHATPGLSWLKPNVKTVENKGVKLGFGYGLMFDYDFSDNYSFSTGLSIMNSGGKVEYTKEYNDSAGFIFLHEDKTDTLSLPATVTYNMGHIEIPVTLKLKTNEIGYMTYFGQFGLSAQMNIKAKGVVSGGGTTKPIDGENILKEVKFFNLALKIGAGFQYSLGGKTHLTVGLFYNNGFLDVINDKGKEKIALNALALNVGIMF